MSACVDRGRVLGDLLGEVHDRDVDRVEPGVAVVARERPHLVGVQDSSASTVPWASMQ